MYGFSAETNCRPFASGAGFAFAKMSVMRTPVQWTFLHRPAGDAVEVGDLRHARQREQLVVAQRELLLDEPADVEPPRRRLEASASSRTTV